MAAALHLDGSENLAGDVVCFRNVGKDGWGSEEQVAKRLKLMLYCRTVGFYLMTQFGISLLS